MMPHHCSILSGRVPERVIRLGQWPSRPRLGKEHPRGRGCHSATPYISGIFHVGPFTCMQEGVATAKIEGLVKEFRKTKPDLVFPIIHAFFGDSAGANLASEIAVFQEQCYQKRDLLRAKHGIPARQGQEIRAVPSGHKTADTQINADR